MRGPLYDTLRANFTVETYRITLQPNRKSSLPNLGLRERSRTHETCRIDAFSRPEAPEDIFISAESQIGVFDLQVSSIIFPNHTFNYVCLRISSLLYH